MKCAHGHTLVLEVPILVNYDNFYSNKLKWRDASLVFDASLVSKQDRPRIQQNYNI
jgi:hypothetical protein